MSSTPIAFMPSSIGGPESDRSRTILCEKHVRALRWVLEGSRYVIENYRGIG
jgi:hypothetical protein